MLRPVGRVLITHRHAQRDDQTGQQDALKAQLNQRRVRAAVEHQALLVNQRLQLGADIRDMDGLDEDC